MAAQQHVQEPSEVELVAREQREANAEARAKKADADANDTFRNTLGRYMFKGFLISLLAAACVVIGLAGAALSPLALTVAFAKSAPMVVGMCFGGTLLSGIPGIFAARKAKKKAMLAALQQGQGLAGDAKDYSKPAGPTQQPGLAPNPNVKGTPAAAMTAKAKPAAGAAKTDPKVGVPDKDKANPSGQVGVTTARPLNVDVHKAPAVEDADQAPVKGVDQGAQALADGAKEQVADKYGLRDAMIDGEKRAKLEAAFDKLVAMEVVRAKADAEKHGYANSLDPELATQGLVQTAIQELLEPMKGPPARQIDGLDFSDIDGVAPQRLGAVLNTVRILNNAINGHALELRDARVGLKNHLNIEMDELPTAAEQFAARVAESKGEYKLPAAGAFSGNGNLKWYDKSPVDQQDKTTTNFVGPAGFDLFAKAAQPVEPVAVAPAAPPVADTTVAAPVVAQTGLDELLAGARKQIAAEDAKRAAARKQQPPQVPKGTPAA